MIRANSTIILLAMLSVFLCAYCFFGKSLMTGEYDSKLARPIEYLTKTAVGSKLAEHYTGQINLWVSQRLVRPRNSAAPPEKEQAYFVMILSRVIFGGFAVILTSFASLGIIFMEGTKKGEESLSKRNIILILILIILNGSLIRLVMAATFHGNCDMNCFTMAADAALAKNNIYAITDHYNYTPIWLMVLGGLERIQLHFPVVTFAFMVRFFGCLVDLASLTFLLLIAKNERLSITKTAALFYLNPVSFLITGYHGQFENFAILMILIGLWAYLKLRDKTVLGTMLLWIFASAGMIVKHNVFYELIICLNTSIRRYWVKLLLFAVSVCAFLATFAPYWSTGSKGIIHNVFMYSAQGYADQYGIMSLFHFSPIKYVFIAGLFIFGFFLKDKDIIRNCLLGMLFFLTFTTGISNQYFVLPIALGALHPSRRFLLYSLAATFFLLGDVDNVYVPGFGFNILGSNVVWLSVMYWFVLEWKQSKKAVSGATISLDRFFA